jgi:hypothetical protein
MNSLALLPGRARLSTKPAPTGSNSRLAERKTFTAKIVNRPCDGGLTTSGGASGAHANDANGATVHQRASQ